LGFRGISIVTSRFGAFRLIVYSAGVPIEGCFVVFRLMGGLGASIYEWAWVTIEGCFVVFRLMGGLGASIYEWAWVTIEGRFVVFRLLGRLGASIYSGLGLRLIGFRSISIYSCYVPFGAFR
jgi:hypothetical protein